MFPDWLAHQAASAPDRPALITAGRAWTFAELDRDVGAVARRLVRHGVQPGDRVATLLHNGIAPALLVHAVLRLGATLVPLNVRLRQREIAWHLSDAAPRLVVVEARTAERIPSPAAGGSLDVIDADALMSGALPPAGDAPLRDSHPADHVLAIIYTSGTTGRPKGAMLTVGNFWWSAVGSALNLGTRADDRWLAVLPLFHVGGLSILLRATIYGIAVVVHEGFDPAAANRAIDDEGATIVSVVAVMLQRMLEARGDRPYPASLRCALLGGGPAPRGLLERCARAGIPVVQTYGLTEATSQVATLQPTVALRKLGAAGRPLYPNALRIVDEAGMEVPRGVVGEITVRGPIVMAGYANQPEATARAIRDGWLHTGDVGRLDDEGYLHVLDRREDLIVSGGENVYPAEVEAVLLEHPHVAEAAVIGVPDTIWGQRVVAVVHLHAPVDVEELRAHSRERLAGYKVPAEFRLVTEPLPRTASGKLQRSRLKAP